MVMESTLILHADPERPDPPSNITEGDTVIEDGKVAVTIHWSPPVNSDLPVSRYKVSSGNCKPNL